MALKLTMHYAMAYASPSRTWWTNQLSFFSWVGDVNLSFDGSYSLFLFMCNPIEQLISSRRRSPSNIKLELESWLLSIASNTRQLLSFQHVSIVMTHICPMNRMHWWYGFGIETSIQQGPWIWQIWVCIQSRW